MIQNPGCQRPTMEATSGASSSQSRAGSMISQIRQSNLPRPTNPQYFTNEDEYVPLLEDEEHTSISSYDALHGDEITCREYVCPENLVDMVNIVRELREERHRILSSFQFQGSASQSNDVPVSKIRRNDYNNATISA